METRVSFGLASREGRWRSESMQGRGEAVAERTCLLGEDGEPQGLQLTPATVSIDNHGQSLRDGFSSCLQSVLVRV